MEPVVTHVEAESLPDAMLSVRWEVDHGPAAVDLAIGPTPDQLDHDHQLTIPAGQTEVVLPGLGRGRWYVSVAPHRSGSAVVAADRRVAFEGITNFRDLGGYRTVDGGRTRWGRVYRADALHGLTATDLALYQRLAVRTVYDLRGDDERTEKPNPFDSHHISLIGQANDAAPEPPPLDATGEELLHRLYVRLIEHAAPSIGRILASMAQPDGLPMVFHCHAGKDRTGVVAALMLEAVGVDRQVVLEDYEATARYRVGVEDPDVVRRLVEMGMSPEAAAGVLSTPRWAMEQALADLDVRFGGVQEYLVGPAGMASHQVEALRANLIEPQTTTAGVAGSSR
jgi:protein-tyrosine phosphatase